MAQVWCNYKDRLPAKTNSLVEWLITKSNTQSHSHFDDVDCIVEYIVFLLTYSKVTVVIEKHNDGNIIFGIRRERNV